jgi:hypothetical protein
MTIKQSALSQGCSNQPTRWLLSAAVETMRANKSLLMTREQNLSQRADSRTNHSRSLCQLFYPSTFLVHTGCIFVGHTTNAPRSLPLSVLQTAKRAAISWLLVARGTRDHQGKARFVCMRLWRFCYLNISARGQNAQPPTCPNGTFNLAAANLGRTNLNMRLLGRYTTYVISGKIWAFCSYILQRFLCNTNRCWQQSA